MVELIIIGGAAAIGSLAGWLFVREHSKKAIALGREQAQKIIGQAKEAAELTLRESEARVREAVAQVADDAKVLEAQAVEANHLLEERMRKLEQRHETQTAAVLAREALIEQRDAVQNALQDEARELRQQAKLARHSFQDGVAEKAGETGEQIKDRLVDNMVEQTRAQCQDRLRNLESTSSEEFMRQAKRVMGISMGRFHCRGGAERVTSSLPLTAEGRIKLTAKGEHLTIMEEMTGVHLAVADSGEWVRFEGGDGVARELGRRVVGRYLAEEQVHDLPQLINTTSAELEREITNTGLEAFRRMSLEPAHPEIVKLVGRLNFRTSYTQNQWHHAIESSFLSGLMAAELGLDVSLARRATLLHDIGKALTHEVEGSHAVIGADLARKYGEDPMIVNAIGSHHADEPPQSSYAYLVAAADAMSGARPGARREMVETYVDRISELERITNQFSGVVMVHAIQAGRELRVHVDEQQVDDTQANKLSEAIAQKISEELTFPGQIRVMVIREFKAVEFAN
jgi:ribonucrease Y